MDCEICKWNKAEKKWQNLNLCRKCHEVLTNLETAPPDFLDSVRVTMIAQEAGV